jgi:DNA-binding NarL/FixJ family response regulator
MRSPTDQIETFSEFSCTSGNDRLRVIVADGSLHYMETVLALLEFHAIVDLIGRAASFEEAIQLVVNHQPDLVLIDLDMSLATLAIPAIILSARATVKIIGMSADPFSSHAVDILMAVDAIIQRQNLWREFLPVVGALYGLRRSSEDSKILPTVAVES